MCENCYFMPISQHCFNNETLHVKKYSKTFKKLLYLFDWYSSHDGKKYLSHEVLNDI